MGTFLSDVRYALRSLLKRPGFTVAATITLALGIGANATVFTFLNAVLFEPIPFKDDRTIFIWSADAKQHNERNPVSIADFADWRKNSESFEQLAAWGSDTRTLAGAGRPERLRVALITANFFPLLNSNPEMGRSFLSSEETGTASSVILSNSFWHERFSADPGVVGKSVTLNSKIYTVVGVMPKQVWFPDVATKAWIPLPVSSNESRGSRYLTVFGKLRNGATIAQARSEMEVLTRQLTSAYPDTNTGITATVLPLDQALLKDTDRAVMRLLVITVMFVLLITCANISNLLLSRGASRQREIAVRTAMGASRGRLIRQLLTESVVLALTGGFVGLLIAFWGAEALIAMIPHRAPPPETLVNGFIFGVTFIVAIVSAMIFGLAPAFELSKTDVNATLKEGGRGSGSVRGRRFRSALIVAEVTLTLVLLIGGGLVIRQAIHLQSLDPGFPTDKLLSLSVEVPEAQYA